MFGCALVRACDEVFIPILQAEYEERVRRETEERARQEVNLKAKGFFLRSLRFFGIKYITVFFYVVYSYLLNIQYI